MLGTLEESEVHLTSPPRLYPFTSAEVARTKGVDGVAEKCSKFAE